MPLRADRLKQLRQRKGFTQAELARLLDVTQQQVARWENGASDSSADAVARLGRTLHCTTDWLLGLVNEPHERVKEPDLSDDEQQLVEMYRQRKLPQMIMRLVTELSTSGTQAQENLTVDNFDEPHIRID